MSVRRGCMNPAVAFELLSRGIYIPHLKGVADENGRLIYQHPVTGKRPSDYEKIMLPISPWRDKSGTAHNLVEMTNALRGEDVMEWWKSVLNCPAVVMTRGGEALFDENGEQILKWEAQPLWDDCQNNTQRRNKIREILFSLQWCHLPIAVRYSHNGEQLEAKGVKEWGLHFSTLYYNANKALCFNFFEKLQLRVDACGEEWKWVDSVLHGTKHFKHLVLKKRKASKPKTSNGQGPNTPTTEELEELIRGSASAVAQEVDPLLKSETWTPGS